MVQIQSVILCLMSLVLAVACSGGDPIFSKKSPDAGDPASNEPADAEETPADEPQQVSGSYLVSCSNDTGVSYVTDEMRSSGLMGCVVTDDTGQKVDAKNIEIILVKDDVETIPEMVPNETDAPWNIGFKVPVAGQNGAEKITVKLSASVATNKIILTTQDFEFDWEQSPLFQPFVVFMKKYYELIGLDTHTFDDMKGIGSIESQGLSAQIIFITDRIVKGDVGVSAADKHCQLAGTKLDPLRSWVSLLTTKEQDIKTKINIKDVVLNFPGAWLADSKSFWSGAWVSAVGYTESGLNVGRSPVTGIAPPFFSTNAWTGLKNDGTFAEDFGNCDDWSAAGKEVRGGTAYAASFVDGVLHFESRSCNRLARFFCISLPKTPAS